MGKTSHRRLQPSKYKSLERRLLRKARTDEDNVLGWKGTPPPAKSRKQQRGNDRTALRKEYT